MRSNPGSSSPLRRTALIHIGDRKTGSTTIQRFLTQNKEAIARRGVVVSEAAFRRVYHSGLTAYALEDDDFGRPARNHWDLHTREDVARFRTDLRDALHAEAKAAPEGATILFSHEDLFRLRNREVARLATLIDGVFDEVRVLVYLRRQPDRDASEYGQLLKNGHTGLDLLDHCRSDYEDLIGRWTKTFGENAVRPRIFATADFANGDLIDDFCAAAGLGDASAYQRVEPANESLSIEAQDFLRSFNAIWPKDRGYPYGVVIHTLLREFGGRGRRPSRRAAKAHLARYRSSNEQVRRRWFPERASLFDDDLSAFPEREPPLSSIDAVTPIVLRLLQRLGDKVDGLRTSIDRTVERHVRLRQRNRTLRHRLETQAARAAGMETAFRSAKAVAAEALASDDPAALAAALKTIAALKPDIAAPAPLEPSPEDDPATERDDDLTPSDDDTTSGR